MRTVALGEVATIERRGVDPSTLPPDTLFLGLEHIEAGGRILGYETVEGAQVRSTKFWFSTRHVLYGKLRPNLAKIARPHFSGVCSTDILPVLPGPKLDRDYLSHYLLQPELVQFTASRASGANLPRLSPAVLENIRVPLPELPEQRRIAAILDQADALRAKRRRVLLSFNTLTRAIFHDMFSKSAAAMASLGDVADFYGGASLPIGEAFTGQGGGTLLMKVSDMNSDGNDRSIYSCGSWMDGRGPRASTVRAGAVILPKRGASISTNKKRLATRDTALDPNLMGVQPSKDKVESWFLYEWLMVFDLSSITSGTSVPQLNKQDLAPLPIQVPTLARQREFSAKARVVSQRQEAYQEAMHSQNVLFASLQSRAFRGEL